MNMLSRLKPLTSAVLVSALLILGCSTANAQTDRTDTKSNQRLNVPTSLVGVDMVLQIEKAVTKLPAGYPYKGAIVKHYKKGGQFTAQGTGILKDKTPDGQQAFYGTYKYKRTSANTAIEKSIDAAVNNTPFTVKYTFETSNSGKWEEDFGNGQIKLSGSFTLESSDLPADQHLAPLTKADTSVALIIKETKSDLPPKTYPTAGLVLQTYSQDGTLALKGFGPGTIDSKGTYKYTKISANTAVEEVTQVSEFFTYPYTMVYNFDTPTSGKWFQNFGDGLILFSGTFNLFPKK